MQNFKAITVADAQRCAQTLMHSAKLMGTTLTHCQALGLVAKENGYASWFDFKEAESARVDALLRPEERRSAADTPAEGYGQEHVLYAKNGFAIRFDYLKEGLIGTIAHARVTDPLGREILYYVDTEFTEEPTFVIGALLQAASRGATSTGSAIASVALPQSHAGGVDLSELSTLVYNGDHCQILSTASKDDMEVMNPEEIALHAVGTHNDRVDIGLTLLQLRSMVWNEKEQGFNLPGDEDQDLYQFYRPVPVKNLNID